jgi:peroxidase
MRLKRGDSFWYERTTGPQKFTPGEPLFNFASILITNEISAQLSQIFDTTLSSIICRNSDHVEYAQRYVMKKVTKTNNMELCSKIDTFDFEPWKEKERGTVKVGVDDGRVQVRSIKT